MGAPPLRPRWSWILDGGPPRPSIPSLQRRRHPVLPLTARFRPTPAPSPGCRSRERIPSPPPTDSPCSRPSPPPRRAPWPPRKRVAPPVSTSPDSSLPSPASAARVGARRHAARRRPWMRPRTAAAPALPCADDHGPAARVGARHGGRAWMRPRTAAAPELQPRRAAPAVRPCPGRDAAAARCCRWGVLLLASPVRRCLPLGRRPGLTGRHCVRPSCCSRRLATAAGPEGAAGCARPGERPSSSRSS